MEDSALELTYQDERYLPDGTFHHIRVKLGSPNRLRRKLAIRADGTITSILQAKKEFGRDYHARFGALGYQVVAELKAHPERLEHQELFGFVFDREHIGESKIRQLLPVAEEFSFSANIAIGSARMRYVDAQNLAKEPGILTVLTAPPQVDHSASDASHMSAAYVSTNTDHNLRGVYGSGVKVAIVERVIGAKNCAVYDTHEAFKYSTITYMTPPSSCSSSDCTHCSLGYMHDGQCTSNKCVYASDHAERVMSRISSSVTNKPLHAAKVHFLCLIMDFP